MDGVTAGRVVHYVPFPHEATREDEAMCFGAFVAGVVTNEGDFVELNLNIATNGDHFIQGVHDHSHEPWVFRAAVPYAALPSYGTWHWPERT